MLLRVKKEARKSCIIKNYKRFKNWIILKNGFKNWCPLFNKKKASKERASE